MDILPCIPADKAFIDMIVRSGVPILFAATAVAITDKRHPTYTALAPNWLSTNPRGIAIWFEDRMRPLARPRILSLVHNRAYPSVDEVPTYDWKPPLHRSIHI